MPLKSRVCGNCFQRNLPDGNFCDLCGVPFEVLIDCSPEPVLVALDYAEPVLADPIYPDAVFPDPSDYPEAVFATIIS
jgi:hypothetical protein